MNDNSEKSGDSGFGSFFKWLGLIIVCIPALVIGYYVSYIFVVMIIPDWYSRNYVDNKRVEKSIYLGKSLTIAPIGYFAKMKDFGGWKDNYKYILIDIPNERVVSSEKIEKYIEFVITEVKKQSGGFPITSKDICIFENKYIKDDLFSENCEYISSMQQATEVFQKSEDQIKKNGYVNLAVWERNHKPNLKLVYKINVFEIYRLNTMNEVKELLLGENENFRQYYNIMDETPYVVSDNELASEYEMSIFSIFSTNYMWRTYTNGSTTYPNYLNSRKIPLDIEDWIKKQAPDSLQQRWALRTVASSFQSILLIHPFYEDSVRNDYNEMLNCVTIQIENKTKFLSDVDTLFNLYLKKIDKQNKLIILKQASETTDKNKTVHMEKNCHLFTPPVKL